LISQSLLFQNTINLFPFVSLICVRGADIAS